jgi:hypothetical protein
MTNRDLGKGVLASALHQSTPRNGCGPLSTAEMQPPKMDRGKPIHLVISLVSLLFLFLFKFLFLSKRFFQTPSVGYPTHRCHAEALCLFSGGSTSILRVASFALQLHS